MDVVRRGPRGVDLVAANVAVEIEIVTIGVRRKAAIRLAMIRMVRQRPLRLGPSLRHSSGE